MHRILRRVLVRRAYFLALPLHARYSHGLVASSSSLHESKRCCTGGHSIGEHWLVVSNTSSTAMDFGLLQDV